MPTGTAGAARFDDGYVVIGAGSKVVDLYLDPLCPYCRRFDQANGHHLLTDAAHDSITLRVHPVAILDRLSMGTQYSTRAAATIVDVAAHDPARLGAYLTALFEHQPEENTPGLTDDEVEDIAAGVGARLHPADLDRDRAWVTEHTRRALAGPLPGTTELPALSSVPTVLVDGHHYAGESDDRAAFEAFYAAH